MNSFYKFEYLIEIYNLKMYLVLRKQIDSLRYDRNRFEQVYEKLEKERVRLRQDIGKVIEESTQSYEQRCAPAFSVLPNRSLQYRSADRLISSHIILR